MKKLAVVLTMIFTLSILAAIGFAMELPLRVVVNGTKINFPDGQPFIDASGRTQTPARFIGEALGATVNWDGNQQKATFVSGSKNLVLYIDKKDYEVNGNKLEMDTVALLKEGRTFVPARYVAEAFGATVSWNDATKTVYINTNATPVTSPTPMKDPITDWIKVETGMTYVEYEISIGWDPDINILNARYDAAEKMFAEEYGEDIAKEVFQYLRQKKLRWDDLPRKEFKLGNKIITGRGAGGETLLQVWREGVLE